MHIVTVKQHVVFACSTRAACSIICALGESVENLCELERFQMGMRSITGQYHS